MDPFAPLARQFCTATLKKCADGKLVINEPGRKHEFGLSEHPSANIQLHASRFWRRAVLGGDIGFAESYIDGDWSSNDLSAVVEFFARNIKHLGAKPSAHPLRSMAHRGLHAWTEEKEKDESRCRRRLPGHRRKIWPGRGPTAVASRSPSP